MAREYFCAYHSLKESLKPYADSECGRLFRAALDYSATGIDVEFTGSERFIWPTIKQMIDRDKATYEAKCETNKANRAKRPSTTVNDRTQEEEKEKEEEEDKEKDKDKTIESVKAAKPRFTPPSVEDVKSYAEEMGYIGFDSERFVDFYSSKGWKVGKDKMTDWKAAVRGWQSRNKPKTMMPVCTPQPIRTNDLEILEGRL